MYYGGSTALKRVQSLTGGFYSQRFKVTNPFAILSCKALSGGAHDQSFADQRLWQASADGRIKQLLGRQLLKACRHDECKCCRRTRHEGAICNSEIIQWRCCLLGLRGGTRSASNVNGSSKPGSRGLAGSYSESGLSQGVTVCCPVGAYRVPFRRFSYQSEVR